MTEYCSDGMFWVDWIKKLAQDDPNGSGPMSRIVLACMLKHCEECPICAVPEADND